MRHAAFVFDAYGTLFDVHAAVRRHAGAAELAARHGTADQPDVQHQRTDEVQGEPGVSAATDPSARPPW